MDSAVGSSSTPGRMSEVIWVDLRDYEDFQEKKPSLGGLRRWELRLAYEVSRGAKAKRF